MKKIVKVLGIMLIILVSVHIFSISQVQAKEIVLVLDPGHGDGDSGAVNRTLGIREDVINLKVVRGIRNYLAPYYGVRVILTHDGLPATANFPLIERGMVARNNKADMMISYHFNDSSDTRQNGAEVYVTANTSLPKYNYESTRFGNIVLKNLSSLGIANRGVKTRLSTEAAGPSRYSDGTVADYYGVIRYPMKGDDLEGVGANLSAGEGIPGILVENCFMNGNDSRFIDSDFKLDLIARANANAIIEYYDLKIAVNIKADKTQVNILKDTTAKVSGTITPIVSDRALTWSSDNTSVATVNSSGIVTAVGQGTCKITATTIASRNSVSITVNVNELQEDQVIEINNLRKEHTVLSQIQPGTLVSSIVESIDISDSLELSLKNSIGKALADEARVGTGTVIEIKDKETGKIVQQYECLIYGDVSGDGLIDSMSMFRLRQHLLGTTQLEGVFLQAANVGRNNNGRVDSMSMFNLRQHLLGNRTIEQ